MTRSGEARSHAASTVDPATERGRRPQPAPVPRSKQAAHLKTIFNSATASQSFVSEWRYVGDSLIDTNRV